MIKLKYMACAALAAMAISCDEDTLTIGNSLTEQNDQLDIVAATFQLDTTRTIKADSVLTLSSKCYLGKVRDPETGADVTSEFTTQFHVLENTYVTPPDSIKAHYDGKAAADSCNLTLYLASPFKVQDSLTAMKIRVHEMDKPVEEGQFYYSNFNPYTMNLLRNGGIDQGKVFTYKNLTQNDKNRENTSYIENITITLNEPYTAKDGTVYNNYGTYLMRTYYEHHNYYRNSYAFSHNVCPGFFFEVVDGLGFHALVSDITLRAYYTIQRDSAVKSSLTLAGTKEVLQTTRITNNQSAIDSLAKESTHTYLKTPAGLFTQVKLPVEKIKNYVDNNGVSHKNDSLLSAKISFQRLNNNSTDYRMLGIPNAVLMVQQDSLAAFFEKSKVPDSKTSYISTFSSTYNTYTFTNISNLITALWNMREKGVNGDPTRGIAADPQWEAHHPNWDKVVLVPVTYKTSTSSSTVSNIEHDMSLTSTRLVGGPDNPNAPIEMNVVYAKFR